MSLKRWDRFTLFLLFMMALLWGCSPQKIVNPEHYSYTKAKNLLTSDIATVVEVEHLTLKRLKRGEITKARARNIDNFIRECNFQLDVAKKLLEAGNYNESLSITKEVHEKLLTILNSLRRTQ